MIRPQLLFLCHTLPYSPDGGVWIWTYHILRLLAREFDVTALCFERARTSQGEERDIASSREGLLPFAAVELFALPHKHSRLRFVLDHLRSTMFRDVYTHYISQSFQVRLAKLVRTGSPLMAAAACHWCRYEAAPG